MARAKNTSRAEARKRTRDTDRAQLVTDGEEIADGVDESATQAPARRPALFKMPNIRDDARALPSMFREKRLLWLPVALVLIGFVLRLVLFGLPTDLQSWAYLYTQFFLIPSGLFAYFIAGFLAPRGSYLVGGIIGALTGVLYGVAETATLPTGSDVAMSEVAYALVVSTFNGAILGTFAGGFAAWYRNFLRNMQQNGDKRRSDKEAQERAKRRNARQESRRVFKQRS